MDKNITPEVGHANLVPTLHEPRAPPTVTVFLATIDPHRAPLSVAVAKFQNGTIAIALRK